MGGIESRGDDRTCGACMEGTSFEEITSCAKRGDSKLVETEVANAGGGRGSGNMYGLATVPLDTRLQAQEAPPQNSPRFHYVAQQATQDSWRLNTNAEDAVGVGAYFGRLDWQTDSVARVKSLVAGGPAEQTGMIDIGDALCAVDDVDVYGRPLCELGKHVLGPSGSVVKLTFEKRKTGERYQTHLVRGKGVLTVM